MAGGTSASDLADYFYIHLRVFACSKKRGDTTPGPSSVIIQTDLSSTSVILASKPLANEYYHNLKISKAKPASRVVG